ncbi:hypothetical protein F4777DRAFT_555081 [Nemania sp. FL0916]|nr:hypothetical protein F4777DRAFT_555081 [Nemania sp. FL0916]
MVLYSGSNSRRVRIIAQHADLDSIERTSWPPLAQEISLSLPEPQALDVTPTFVEENFDLKSLCFVDSVEIPDNSTVDLEDSVCLFLYQQNSSTMYNEPPWNATSTLTDAIREPGPAAYQTFPAHQFFARVYRPSAIWAALLNRQPTFLCNPEWTVVPWAHYPRTPLDDLLDIVVLLPSIFSRADEIIMLEASSERQSRARDLLDNCVNIEAQFNIWLSVIRQDSRTSGAPYWVAESREGRSNLPFDVLLNFASPLLCLVHIYYWTFLISFHQCIYTLLDVIREPGDEESNQEIELELPAGLDPRKYQPAETRMLAALVCRSLDFALRTTTQPDLLAAPVWVIREFYNRMKELSLCEPESLWLDDFTTRHEARSREICAWLEEKRWVGIRRFG